MVRFRRVFILIAALGLAIGCGKVGPKTGSQEAVHSDPEKSTPKPTPKKSDFDKDFNVDLEPPRQDQPQVSEPEDDYSHDMGEIPPEQHPEKIPVAPAPSQPVPPAATAAPPPAKTEPSVQPDVTAVPEFVGPPAPEPEPVKPISAEPSITAVPEFVGPPAPPKMEEAPIVVPPTVKSEPQAQPQPEPAKPQDFTASIVPKNQAFYRVDTNGSLQNPSSLIERLQSYKGVSPFEINATQRSRYYGTSEMIEFVDYIAQYYSKNRKDYKLYVSDISLPSGGPIYRVNQRTGKPDSTMGFAHQAHRNGLDVDISFIYLNPLARFFDYKEKNDRKFLETLPELKQQFADNKNKVNFRDLFESKPELKQQFNKLKQNSLAYIIKTMDLKTQFDFLKHAVKVGSLELMFVYPMVKVALCRQAGIEGAFEKGQEKSDAIETLRRIFPDYPKSDPENFNRWGHGDHVHFRMKCDKKKHPKCDDPPSMVTASHGCLITPKGSAP